MDKVIAEPLINALINATKADKTSLEVLTALDIMRMCLSGLSNNYISLALNIPKDEVAEVLCSTLGHQGWEDDLGFSPLAVFKDGVDIDCYPSYPLFLSSLVHYMQTNTPPPTWLFDLCYRFTVIEDFLERSIK